MCNIGEIKRPIYLVNVNFMATLFSNKEYSIILAVFGNYRSLGKNKTKIISIKCNNLWCILVFLAHDTLLILCRQVEKRILDTLMDPKVYDARIRPSGANDTDSATVVIVNIFVRSFSKIDDVKMVSSCHSHINLSNRNMISIFIKWWFFRKNLMYILYI